MHKLIDDHYQALTNRRDDLASRLYREPHLKAEIAKINEEIEGYFDFTLPEKPTAERIEALKKETTQLKALVRSLIADGVNDKSITFAPLPSLTQYDETYTHILEGLINECCSLRDVMNYPNGETILNAVRESVASRKPLK